MHLTSEHLYTIHPYIVHYLSFSNLVNTFIYGYYISTYIHHEGVTEKDIVDLQTTYIHTQLTNTYIHTYTE